MARSKVLTKAFREYNRKYFDNELPEDTHVCWAQMPEALLGYQHGEFIAINRELRLQRAESIWRLTLLHEMCHLKLPPRVIHGKKFQDEMRRLANAGAFDFLW